MTPRTRHRLSGRAIDLTFVALLAVIFAAMVAPSLLSAIERIRG